VEAMVPARVLLTWIVRYAREIFDDQYKGTYLRYPQAREVIAEMENLRKSAPNTEAHRFGGELTAATLKIMTAQARIERKLAALRIIEALRLHAAAHGGQLPDRLDQVTEVPIPDDPGTGKPFGYIRDGATATLMSRIPGETLATSGLRYKLTIRKPG
jgi:hypothetical protein